MTNYHLNRLAVAVLAFVITLYPIVCRSATARLDDGTTISYHQTLTAANSAIASGSNVTITAQAGTFRESLNLDRGGNVRLRGGYDAGFTEIVGSTRLEGALTITTGSLVADNITVAAPLTDMVRIIYLHHSTGGVIWDAGVPGHISTYNGQFGTDYRITEQAYPDGVNYPWENYPYDYWKLWVDTSGPIGYLGQDTLDNLAEIYDVIVFKHCFPVSSVEAETGFPDITSSYKSLENYKLQYNALKARLRQFPTKKFIVWTGAALTLQQNTQENAGRARQFFDWVKTTWDEKGDNIFVWDFWSLETEGGLYLKPEYASGEDSHPNGTFASAVSPLIVRRIVDVIEGAGDSGSITGATVPVPQQ